MAFPGGQTNHNATVTAPTVTNASSQVIAANRNRYGLLLANPSATATLSICPASFGAAVASAAGMLTLAPNTFLLLEGVRCVDAFNAISSVAASPMTIWEF